MFYKEFIENLFKDFESKFDSNELRSDIIKYDDKVEVLVEVCGFTKEDLEISIEENLLVVKTNSKEEGNLNYIQKERVKKSLERKFEISEDIDYELIKASVNNGLLTVSMPLKIKNKKTVEIN